jgi:hypothetical protein
LISKKYISYEGMKGVCIKVLCGNGRGRNNENYCEECGKNMYSNDGGIVCERCPDHSRANGDKSGCICNIGYKKKNDVNNECEECPSGTYGSSPGICENCSDYSTPNIERDECICDIGYKKKENSDECEACESGMYGSLAGVCSECEEGRYSNESGLTSCLLCSNVIGSTGISEEDRKYCLCKSGYTNDNNGGCEICGVGKYEKDGICIECGDGGSTTPAGSSSCTCGGGYGKNSDGGCESCNENSYSSSEMSECVDCPVHSITNTEKDECICNIGYKKKDDVNNECEECPSGTYGSSPGICENCPDHSTPNIERDECICDKAYEKDDVNGGCKRCSSGTYGSSPGICENCSDYSDISGCNEISGCTIIEGVLIEVLYL